MALRQPPRIDVVRWAHTTMMCTCVAAAIVIPGHFNARAEEPFEQDKVLVLRTIALVAAGALAIAALFGPRPSVSRAAQDPLVVTAAAAIAAHLLATAVSIAPHASVWGTSPRWQGAGTFLSYVVLFAIIVLLRKRPGLIDDLTTAAIVGSVLPAIYACFQALRFDALAWGITDRVSSTAGNPMFLAGYLVMVWPLTLARALSLIDRRPASRMPAIACLTLLGCQTIAIAASHGRGSWIGWAVGMTFLAVLRWAPRSRRRRRVPRRAIVAGASLAVALVVAQARILPPDRAFLDGGTGSGRVRLLIWREALSVLAANPLRTFVGYGPEAVSFVFERYQEPELNRLEHGYLRVDRAHNAMLDVLITTGLIGFAAQTALWLAVFASGLHVMNLLNTATDIRKFVGAVVACAAGGVFTTFVVGHMEWFAIAFSAGFVCGLFAYVLYSASRARSPAGDDAATRTLLMAALLASLLSHFVEIQFAFPTTLSSLLFWMNIALIVILGRKRPETEAEVPRFDHERRGLLGVAMAGASVAVFVADFAVAPVISFGAVCAIGVCCAAIASGVAFVDRTLAGRVALPRPDPVGTHRGARVVALWRTVAAGLAAGVVAAGTVRNVSTARASVLALDAQQHERRQEWPSAHQSLADAIAHAPAEPRYLGRMALVLLQEAYVATDPRARVASLEQATALVERALASEPVNTDYIELLARVHLTWAQMSTRSDEKLRHSRRADELFGEAARRRPADPAVWNAWALLDLDRGRYAEALEKVNVWSTLEVNAPAVAQLRASIVTKLGK
jgi:O-antigen ligase